MWLLFVPSITSTLTVFSIGCPSSPDGKPIISFYAVNAMIRMFFFVPDMYYITRTAQSINYFKRLTFNRIVMYLSHTKFQSLVKTCSTFLMLPCAEVYYLVKPFFLALNVPLSPAMYLFHL